MAEAWDTLKLLSDATRLRVILLLRNEELSVAELQEILDMGQSRISSHLALLRNGGLLEDRKEGKRTYYSYCNKQADSITQLIESACNAVRNDGQIEQDQAHLQRVLESRRQVSERYFNEIANRIGKNYCPGRSWEAMGHFLLRLTPKIDIVDLGAGEGILAHLLAPRARHIHCIDNSPKMVEIGTEIAKAHGLENLTYKLGDIEDVPLPAECADLVYLSQALHHAQHPLKALKEAYRLLRPGGQLLVIDLNKHAFEKARDLYADLWLGFSENTMYEYFKECGLSKIEVNVVAEEKEAPYFETLLACGFKPSKVKE
ncbi:MAG: ArsR family transcriptional regulator [Opitutales bacterium]|nr:ArsR family transcriptional regulator [Opitutales bacterium]